MIVIEDGVVLHSLIDAAANCLVPSARVRTAAQKRPESGTIRSGKNTRPLRATTQVRCDIRPSLSWTLVSLDGGTLPAWRQGRAYVSVQQVALCLPNDSHRSV